MKIPAMLYGRAVQVQARMRNFAQAVVASGDLREFGRGPLLDTSETGGVILVDEETWPSKEDRFHCYVLSDALASASPQAQIRSNLHAWLMSSLDIDSRFVCTLGGDAWMGLDECGPLFARRYVEASIRHWPAMKLSGIQFGPARDGVYNLLQCWRTLFYALGKLGLSARERMRIPGREPSVLFELITKLE